MLKVTMETNLLPENEKKQGVGEQSSAAIIHGALLRLCRRGNRCLCRRLPFQYGEYTSGKESIYLYAAGLINIAKGGDEVNASSRNSDLETRSDGTTGSKKKDHYYRPFCSCRPRI